MGKNKIPKTAVIILGFFLLPFTITAQVPSSTSTRSLSLQQSIDEALKNNNSVKIAEHDINVQKALKKGSITMSKTEFSYTQGVVSNPTINDNLISVTQRIDFPTLYTSQAELAREKISSSEKFKALTENNLIENVKLAYLQYQYALEKKQLLLQLDSIYGRLSKASNKRYQTGETTSLENMTSLVQSKQIQNEL